MYKKEIWKNNNLRKLASEYSNKRWNNHNFPQYNLTNIKTKETVVISSSLKKWCESRELNYKKIHQLIRGKVKVAQDWFLGTEEPVYIERKGEKRKPLTQEHRDKISNALNKGKKIILINWKTNEKIEVTNFADFATKISVNKRSLSKLINNTCPSIKDYIVYKIEYEKPVLDIFRNYFSNIFEASKHYNTFPWKILNVCLGNQSQSKGMIFFFADEHNIENDIQKLSSKSDRIVNENIKGIYVIKNILNKKYYIGSSVDIVGRWAEHKRHLIENVHDNIHLQLAWNKYGENSFEFVILEEMSVSSSIDDIRNKEQCLLDMYFDNGKNCYNISKKTDGPDINLLKIPIYQLDKITKEIIKEWDSTADAERGTGIKFGIYNALKGRLISAGGFCWRYKNDELAAKYPPRIKNKI